MKKYDCSSQAVSELDSSIKNSLLTSILYLGIIIVSILLIINESYVGYVPLVLFTLLFIITVTYFIKLCKVQQGIQHHQLEIHDTYICGMICKDYTAPGNADYFEFPIDEIRKIETASFDCKTSVFHTLAIYTIHNSYKLCIGNSRDAALTLSGILNGEPVSAPAPSYTQPAPRNYYSPQPPANNAPYSYQQTPVNPTHTPQQQSYNTPRQQNSLNPTYVPQQSVSKAPYRCGKCGQPGPYESSCPQCGSTIKFYNN